MFESGPLSRPVYHGTWTYKLITWWHQASEHLGKRNTQPEGLLILTHLHPTYMIWISILARDPLGGQHLGGHHPLLRGLFLEINRHLENNLENKRHMFFQVKRSERFQKRDESLDFRLRLGDSDRFH